MPDFFRNFRRRPYVDPHVVAIHRDFGFPPSHTKEGIEQRIMALPIRFLRGVSVDADFDVPNHIGIVVTLHPVARLGFGYFRTKAYDAVHLLMRRIGHVSYRYPIDVVYG